MVLTRCGGLDVEFPFTPYGIQKAMLAKIAVTLTNKENSLIESPTGTGKTLVLLCGTLAWQQQSKIDQTPLISNRKKKELAAKRLEKLMTKPCSCGRRPDQPADDDVMVIKELKKEGKEMGKENNNGTEKPNGKISEQMCLNCEAIKAEDEYNDELGISNTRVRLGKVPKIFYGTRTHKQIAQVVGELKKTCYTKDLKTCILSSRDRTCTNDDVRELASRNDRCQELVKNSGNKSKSRGAVGDTCPYYKENNALAAEFEQIHEKFKDDAWDIEDANTFAREQRLCTYYGLRSIQIHADITFCPYNYLLDPNIRKALDINIHNSVIIFDEAHNIEDICRDSASFVINTPEIDDILNTISRAAQLYIQGSTVRDAYDFFRNLFTDIKACLVKFTSTLDQYMDGKPDGDCLARRIMQDAEMADALRMMNIGPKCLQAVKDNVKALRGDDDDSSQNNSSKNDDSPDIALNNQQLQFITQLANTLEFMYSNSNKYYNDFRCIISKHLERKQFRRDNKNNPNNPETGDVHVLQLSLLCMNSGIAFEKIHSSAWSVIVASGTLSPLESLKTELGCQFSQVFEGSHVIEDERIYATIVARGPKGVDLNCAYGNSLQLNFQDEIGSVVRDVCSSVPNGVLCFFPSYERMENLYQRWFTRGFIKDIQTAGKKLYREQKSFTAAKFEEELQKYHKSAKGRGALLFAVFRGKVSEGIDFSDTAARAVITIGIPYPNVKEVTIGLKKDYNDQARVERPHLMSGRDWYSAQAFRALNQALGRCIRHKNDWGAIIMIDSRLSQYSSANSISKWIRRVISMPRSYQDMSETLKEFVEARQSEKVVVLD